jgi:hypothetical protein
VVFATPPFWLANAMTLALPVTWCSDHGRVDPSSTAIRTPRRRSFPCGIRCTKTPGIA